MKRISTNQKEMRTGIIRIDLNDGQLMGIGLVAATYNEAEIMIDVLLTNLLGLSQKMSIELTSRINGIDGKIELLKIGIRELDAPAVFQSLLSKTLGKDGKSGFTELKKYRDGIIHARVTDASIGVALTPGKRGAVYDILLTEKALEAVVERNSTIRHEFVEAHRIIAKLREVSGLPKSQREQEIQAMISLYQLHQKHRLSLPQLPEFPSETEVHQAHVRWLDLITNAIKSISPQPENPPYQRKMSAALWSTMGVQAPPHALINTPTPAKKKK